MRVEKGTRVCGSWTLICTVSSAISTFIKTTDLILYSESEQRTKRHAAILHGGFKGRVQGMQIHMYVIKVGGACVF